MERNFARERIFAENTFFISNVRETCILSAAFLVRIRSSRIAVFSKFELKVNDSKTDVILFRASRVELAVPGIRIGGSVIHPSPATKCLDVMLHERLGWDNHLWSITLKCYAVVAQLRHLRTVGIPIEGLILVYKALFVPPLAYCISLWGGCCGKVVRAAQVVQNDAIRSIPDVRRCESVRCNYHSLDIARVLYDSFPYKISKATTPENILPRLVPKVTRATRRRTVGQPWRKIFPCFSGGEMGHGVLQTGNRGITRPQIPCFFLLCCLIFCLLPI